MTHLLGIHISREVLFSRNSHFPGSHISREFTFPGKSYFLRSHITREVTLFWKSHIPENYISRENQISREIKFPGKSHFPGSHEVPLVKPKIVIICQNLIIGEEGKKRLVDLRRSLLMASPQVKSWKMFGTKVA